MQRADVPTRKARPRVHPWDPWSPTNVVIMHGPSTPTLQHSLETSTRQTVDQRYLHPRLLPPSCLPAAEVGKSNGTSQKEASLRLGGRGTSPAILQFGYPNLAVLMGSVGFMRYLKQQRKWVLLTHSSFPDTCTSCKEEKEGAVC